MKLTKQEFDLLSGNQPLEGANLEGANLEGANLEGIDVLHYDSRHRASIIHDDRQPIYVILVCAVIIYVLLVSI